MSSTSWEEKCSMAQISTWRWSSREAEHGRSPSWFWAWNAVFPHHGFLSAPSSWELLCLAGCPSDFSECWRLTASWLQSEELFLQFALLEGLTCVPLFAALPPLAVPGMWNAEHFLTCTWQFVSVSLQLAGQWGLCALIADPLKCWLFQLLEFFANIKSLHKWSCATSTKHKRGEVKLKMRYIGLQSTKINMYLSWSLKE